MNLAHKIYTKQFSNLNISYLSFDQIAQSSIHIDVPWEPHIQNFIKIYLNLFKVNNIADIGANFGYHSLLLSQLDNFNGKIYAFEPQPQNYFLLEKNIKDNNINNIIPYNCALSNATTTARFPIIKDNISKDQSFNMGEFSCNWNADGEHAVINVVELDSLSINNLDIIKLDVQGWEKNVLDGAKETIKKNKPLLIVEFEHFQLAKLLVTCKDLAEYIRDMGYYIFYLDYKYPADHVCVHQDNLEMFNNLFTKYIFNHKDYNGINFNTEWGVDRKINCLYD